MPKLIELKFFDDFDHQLLLMIPLFCILNDIMPLAYLLKFIILMKSMVMFLADTVFRITNAQFSLLFTERMFLEDR